MTFAAATVAASCVVLAASIPGQSAAVPARFARVLYLHGGPAPGDALWPRLRALGFDAINARGGQPLPDGAADAGLGFYIDQIVGKGVLELRAAQWDPLVARYERTRDPVGLVRPGCMSLEATVDALTDKIADGLGAVAGRAPIGIALADEASATRRLSPLDVCHGSACRSAFRSFLRARYGTVDALGVAWGHGYDGWGEVEPWTADEIRARELRPGQLPANLTPWSDHLEFRDRVFAGLVSRSLGQIATLSGRPAGLTGMQAPAAYGGYDYVKLMPSQTFYETYDIGGARALARSLAPAGAVEIATLFPLDDGSPARLVEAQLFDAAAHGLSGVVVWSSGEVFDDDGETRFGRAVGSAFAALRVATERAAGARVVHAPIWIVESQASVRAHWMLDSAADGRTWIRRLGSYESTHSTSQAVRASWLRLFEDLGYQPRLVPATGLREALRVSPPRLLVLPAILALSDESVTGIADYVSSGGQVIADHGTGIYDETLTLRSRPALDEVFGLAERDLDWPRVLEGRGSDRDRTVTGVAIAEPGVRAEVAEPVGGGRMIHCESDFGRGRAVYLNLAVCEYAGARLEPTKVELARDLRARVRRVLADAGAAPPVAVRVRGLPACVEVVELEARRGARLLAVRVNALASPELAARLGEDGPKPVVLEFPREVRLTDVMTGEDLGRRRRFECTLDPFAGLLFEVEDR